MIDYLHHLFEPIAPWEVLVALFCFTIIVDGPGLVISVKGFWGVFVSGCLSPVLDSFGVVLAQSKVQKGFDLYDSSAAALSTGLLTSFGELWAFAFFIIAGKGPLDMTPTLFLPVVIFFGFVLVSNALTQKNIRQSEILHTDHVIEVSTKWWIFFIILVLLLLIRVPMFIVFGISLFYLLSKEVRSNLKHTLKHAGIWISTITVIGGTLAYYAGIRIEAIHVASGIPNEILIFISSMISGPATSFIMPTPENDAVFVRYLFTMAAGVVLSPSGGIVNLLVLREERSWINYIKRVWKYSALWLLLAWIYPVMMVN